MFESNSKTSLRRKPKPSQGPERTKLKTRRLFLESLEDRRVMAFVPGDVFVADGGSAPHSMFNVTGGGDFTGVPALANLGSRSPGQIAWSADLNTAYVTLFDIGVVRAVTSTGTLTDFATGLTDPTGLIRTNDGRILVSKFASGEVIDITAGGDFTGATPFASGLSGPRNMVQLLDGRILITEQGSGQVTDITAGGNFSATTPFASGLSSGTDIVQSASGAIFVAEFASNEVTNVTAGGDFSAATPFAIGRDFIGLTFDGSGRLLASELSGTELFDISAGGNFSAATPFAFNLSSFSGESAIDTVPAAAGSMSAAINGSGNLVVTDTDAAGKANALTVSNDGAGNIVITDANEQFAGTGGIAGATLSNGNKTLTVPVASITGTQIILNTMGGNDSVTASVANSLGKILSFNGGNPTTGPGDKLIVTGGSHATLTLNHTNSSDGSVVLGASTINYTGLEPVDITGTTITNLVINLPDTDDATDDDTKLSISAGNLIVDSLNGEHEDDSISLTGITSITVNAREGADSITLDKTLKTFAGAIAINGGNDDDTLTVDLSDGDFASTITYTGGLGSDTLTISGGTLATAALSFPSATDVSLSLGLSSILPIGIEQIALTATTITNLSINLPDIEDADDDDTNFSLVGTNLVIDSQNGEHLDAIVSLTGVAALTINGRAGDDEITLDSSLAAFAGAGGITVNGGTQSDLFNVEIGAADFAAVVTINGDGQSAGIGDMVVIDGGVHALVTVNHTNANDGSVVLDGTTIIYTGLEPVDITGSTITDLVVNLPDTDDPGVDDDTQLSIVGGHLFVDALTDKHEDTLIFLAPTVASITINARGGDDMIRLDSSLTTFGGTLLVNGGANSDELDLSLLAISNVDLTAESGTAFNGSVTGTLTLDFQNFEEVTANGATNLDSLTGLDEISTWTIDDANGSTYKFNNTLTFNGFDTLSGESKADTFNVLETSATTKYSIVGQGGVDSLSFATYKVAAADKSVEATLTAAAADGYDGTVKVAGGASVFVDFSDIDTITGNNAETLDSLTGLDEVATWTVNDLAGNTYVSSVTANPLAFGRFESLTGGTKADTYEIEDTSATTKYTIAGKDGVDKLNFDTYKVAAADKSVEVTLQAAATDGYDGEVMVAGGATVFVDFSDVDNVVGNTTALLDSLTGLNEIATWTINDATGSSYSIAPVVANTLAFNRFESLTGNTKADTYEVEDTSTTAKYTIAAKDGIDKLSFSAYKVAAVNKSVDTTLKAAATDGFDGEVKVAGGATVFVDFSDVDNVVGNATETLDSLTGLNEVATWTVNDAAGSKYAVPAVVANTLGFNRYESLIGNSQADTYEMEDTSTTTTYTITAKDGVDKLSFSAYKVAAANKSVDITFKAAAADGYDGETKVAAGATVFVNFSDVDNFVGNATTALDSLTGLNSNSTWTINEAAGSTYVAPAITANTAGYSKIESLNGHDAKDTYKVQNNVGQAYSLNGNKGSDTFLVGDTVNSLSALESLKIDGGANAADTDEMSLLDTAQAGTETYTFSPTGITFETTKTIAPTTATGFNVEVLKLNASSGANTINVTDGNYSDVVGGINTKEADLFLLHAANANKSALNIEDMADLADNTWTINSTKTTRTAPAMAFRIDYTSTALSAAKLDAGKGSDTLTMTSTPSQYTMNGHEGREKMNIEANGHATFANGQEDNDTMNVATGNLETIQGSLMVDGGTGEALTRTVFSGGTASGKTFAEASSPQEVGDTLNVMDHNKAGLTDYTINNATITRMGAPQAVNYKNFDMALTKAGSGDSDVFIDMPLTSALNQLPTVICIDGGNAAMDNRVRIKGNTDLTKITTGNMGAPETDRSQFELASVTRMWIEGGTGKNEIHNRSSVPALIDGNTQKTLAPTGGTAQNNFISSEAFSTTKYSPVILGNDGLDFLHTKNDAVVGTTYLVGDYFINNNVPFIAGSATKTSRLQVVTQSGVPGESGDLYFNEGVTGAKNVVLARRDTTAGSFSNNFFNVTADSLGNNLTVIDWLRGRLGITVTNAGIAGRLAEINFHVRQFLRKPGDPPVPAIGSQTYRPGGVAKATPNYWSPNGGEATEPAPTEDTTSVVMTNPFEAGDVNGDGRVTAFDALIIVNELNLNGAHALDTSITGDFGVLGGGENRTPIDFLDVNGDQAVSAFDALLVINKLNLGQGSYEVPEFNLFGNSDLLESEAAYDLADSLVAAGSADSLTDEALLALLAGNNLGIPNLLN